MFPRATGLDNFSVSDALSLFSTELESYRGAVLVAMIARFTEPL